MSKTKVFVRLGISDITVSPETQEKMSGYARIYDDEGNLITDSEIYLVGYELEDGSECDEFGIPLNYGEYDW